MNTRAELRDLFEADDDATPPRRERRPLLRSFRFWIPISILLVLIGLVVAALVIVPRIADRAFAARDALQEAIPLANTVKDQIASGNVEEAKATIAKLSVLTGEAREQTDDEMWKNLEWVPVVGPNLHAVRVASAVTDDLVTDALTPATSLNLASLRPAGGAIDLNAITAMSGAVTQAADALDDAAAELGTIDRDALIPQVEDGIAKLDDAVVSLQPALGPARDIIGILPTALGADGPRNYLMLFQNVAESRGTGGNPAALVLVTADQGRITISQQASSGDFKNRRETPIIPIAPETEALYGDKIGRWMMDVTLTPDFTETAQIIRAFWAESVGTPVDAVMSFDPVALGYLLKATGPVTVSPQTVEVEGHSIQVLDRAVELNGDNAAAILLNQVYSMIPDTVEQDAFFALAAQSVFGAVTSGSGEPMALLKALSQAADEGRLMYVPTSEPEAALVGDSRLSGRLPADNATTTMLGAYVNDITEGKLDYYLQLDIAATTTQCQAPDAPSFTTSATLTNTLAPDQVAGLATYIAPGRFFAKGDISTDLVLYGPVGSTFASATVDGAGVGVTALPHLGRPAVKINVVNAPGQTHTIAATFTGAAGEYGPLEVRHTPLVRTTNVAIDAPGCE
ncbi:DUF4012 domain-containing protein [Microbacterium sp. SD291]|uniref:DUF4012 domain-containing protein n=1 Tax=Microbacterium sp. SD291 TaxID=2782007 RepID=UPI001A96218A|nr:DUF4012 domain-containing protein [Microbacterium sp. SD291]MBO0980991.1 DUF4012 domain-containing protein [Microbacterium sp. SD291]